MKERVDYLDYMRGIGIILVVLQHCICDGGHPLATFIVSFHMPLFFFISGSVLKLPKSILGGIKNKVKSIIFPQITLGIISILTTLIIDVFIQKEILISDVDFLRRFAFWFLPVLFGMIVIMYLSLYLAKVVKGAMLIFLSAALCLFLLDNYSENYIQQMAQQIICALIFGILGYLVRPYVDRYNHLESRFKGIGYVGIVIVAVLAWFNEPIGMYTNRYGCKLYFLIVAILGIFSVMDIAMLIKSNYLFKWLGCNSLIIYVFQFSLIEIFNGVYSGLIPNAGINESEYPYFLLVFLTVMLSTTIIVPMVKRYIPWAFGK